MIKGTWSLWGNHTTSNVMNPPSQGRSFAPSQLDIVCLAGECRSPSEYPFTAKKQHKITQTWNVSQTTHPVTPSSPPFSWWGFHLHSIPWQSQALFDFEVLQLPYGSLCQDEGPLLGDLGRTLLGEPPGARNQMCLRHLAPMKTAGGCKMASIRRVTSCDYIYKSTSCHHQNLHQQDQIYHHHNLGNYQPVLQENYWNTWNMPKSLARYLGFSGLMFMSFR